MKVNTGLRKRFGVSFPTFKRTKELSGGCLERVLSSIGNRFGCKSKWTFTPHLYRKHTDTLFPLSLPLIVDVGTSYKAEWVVFFERS